MVLSMVKRDVFNTPFLNLDDWFDNTFNLPRNSFMWNVPYERDRADVKRVEGGEEVRVVAPGLKKEDFRVEVADGMLSISCSSQSDVGCLTHSFAKRWQLHPHHRVEGIKARYDAGVLYVLIPIEQTSMSSVIVNVE